VAVPGQILERLTDATTAEAVLSVVGKPEIRPQRRSAPST